MDGLHGMIRNSPWVSEMSRGQKVTVMERGCWKESRYVRNWLLIYALTRAESSWWWTHSMPGIIVTIVWNEDLVLFRDRCKAARLKIRIQFLNHLCEELAKNCNILFLDAVLYERFNIFGKNIQEIVNEKSHQIGGDSRGPGPALKKVNGNKGVTKGYFTSAAKVSLFQAWDVDDSVFQRVREIISMEQLLRIVAISAAGSTSQEHLVLNAL